MQISDKGLAFLEAHEGVVLKAYRDPVGILTIGAGLTNASGVVKVRPGMVISRAEASRLLALALRRNYEPRVAKAMPGAEQHEFDAGTSFDWNTGAIAKATWVKRWRANAAADLIRAGLMAWNKGGGRVLPGLTRRRQEEAAMLLKGFYAGVKVSEPATGNARWAVVLDAGEIAAIREGFRKLGYAPGPDASGVRTAAAIQFQQDHDLKADGIIGRATLSTLQRALDARAKGKPAAAATAATGGATALPEATTSDLPILTDLPWLAPAALGLAVVYGLWLAWRYRDQVAAAIQSPLPRLAAFLRSF